MTEAEIENSSSATVVDSAQPKNSEVAKQSTDVKEAVRAINEAQNIKSCDGKLEAKDGDAKVEVVKPDGKGEDAAKPGEESTNVEQKPEVGQRREPWRRPFRGPGNFGGRFRYMPIEEQRRWEEEQKQKPILQQGVTGKVKWYSFRKNYGFIQRDDDQKDVFVHQLAISKSRIRKPQLRTLGHDEIVQFDVVQGKKGHEASNVTGPNGTEVQGSRIIFVYNDSFDRFDRPRLPYYNDFNRRPGFFPGNNFARNQNYRNRDVARPNADGGAYYKGPRPFYPGNRGRPMFDKFDRPPYHRQREYRGRRRNPTPEQSVEENAEKKEATAVDDKNDVKANKITARRRGGRMRTQRPRNFKYQKGSGDGAKPAQTESSSKEISTEKPVAEDGKKPNVVDDVKKVDAIEVKA